MIKLTDQLRPLLTPTGFTGGAGNLDGAPTLNLTTGLAFVRDANVLSPLRLLAGTDAEDAPFVVHPDDYAGGTNEKIYKLMDLSARSLVATQKDAGTSDVADGLVLSRRSSGTPAAGFGIAQSYRLQSSTTVEQEAGRVEVYWSVATHASRNALWKLKLAANGAGPSDVLIAGEINVFGSLSKALGIGTIPVRPLHLLSNNTGNVTMVAMENPNTTNNNGAVFSIRSTTTGTGGASFQDCGGFGLTITEHNHATRASKLVFSWLNAGAAEVLDLLPGYSVRLNSQQVLTTRKTGWTVPSGSATRTGFDTATVTLPALAEAVKALIDDLHATAGHGLIGT